METDKLSGECDGTSGEAMTFLNMARKYQKAGSRLLYSIEGDDKADPERALSDPIYFLFAHTLELAFKAFLLFRGEVIPTSGKAGHDIVELRRQCAALLRCLRLRMNNTGSVTSTLSKGTTESFQLYRGLAMWLTH